VILKLNAAKFGGQMDLICVKSNGAGWTIGIEIEISCHLK
jgi:hypothetical protein